MTLNERMRDRGMERVRDARIESFSLLLSISPSLPLIEKILGKYSVLRVLAYVEERFVVPWIFKASLRYPIVVGIC